MVSEAELRIDDGFAIHYNESHWNTKVAKHMDPSDITVNLCLERSDDLEGSQVMFFGRQSIRCAAQPGDPEYFDEAERAASSNFLVTPMTGWATIHWGHHPHLVTSLSKGQRTNVVMTYVYVDKARSQAYKRDCFQDQSLR